MDKYDVKKLVHRRRAMERVRQTCDDQNLPYPAELIAWLQEIQRFRSGD